MTHQDAQPNPLGQGAPRAPRARAGPRARAAAARPTDQRHENAPPSAAAAPRRAARASCTPAPPPRWIASPAAPPPHPRGRGARRPARVRPPRGRPGVPRPRPRPPRRPLHAPAADAGRAGAGGGPAPRPPARSRAPLTPLLQRHHTVHAYDTPAPPGPPPRRPRRRRCVGTQPAARRRRGHVAHPHSIWSIWRPPAPPGGAPRHQARPAPVLLQRPFCCCGAWGPPARRPARGRLPPGARPPRARHPRRAPRGSACPARGGGLAQGSALSKTQRGQLTGAGAGPALPRHEGCRALTLNPEMAPGRPRRLQAAARCPRPHLSTRRGAA